MQTNMPTASRLFAAAAFTIVGFMAANVAVPHLPEGTVIGAFIPISALIGLVGGWRILGRETGKGMYNSALSGLKTTALVLLLATFIFATERMLTNAFRRAYDGPMEAVIGIISSGLEYGQVLLNPDLAFVLVAGGVLSGLLAEWAANRWK
jgi:hypothetical protein